MSDAALRQRTSGKAAGSTTTVVTPNASSEKVDYQKGKTWGRARDVDLYTIIMSFVIMATCPGLVIYFWRACDTYQCDLVAPAAPLIDLVLAGKGVTLGDLSQWVLGLFPQATK
ncbi:7-dehydrocholesterol reductase, partial [Blyttiomyces sp. JEL0837]